MRGDDNARGRPLAGLRDGTGCRVHIRLVADRVSAIDTGVVTKVIEPIWNTTPETASRLRGRIESVLDWVAAGARAA